MIQNFSGSNCSFNHLIVVIFSYATTENHKLIDLQKLTKKRVTLSWEWMYSKSYEQTEDMISQHKILTHLARILQRITNKGSKKFKSWHIIEKFILIFLSVS